MHHPVHLLVDLLFSDPISVSMPPPNLYRIMLSYICLLLVHAPIWLLCSDCNEENWNIVTAFLFEPFFYSRIGPSCGPPYMYFRRPPVVRWPLVENRYVKAFSADGGKFHATLCLVISNKQQVSNKPFGFIRGNLFQHYGNLFMFTRSRSCNDIESVSLALQKLWLLSIIELGLHE